jgi:hypothetical protein
MAAWPPVNFLMQSINHRHRLAAIDFQIDLDPCLIKWKMIDFCDRNFDQFLQFFDHFPFNFLGIEIDLIDRSRQV